jgi:hypothetical protein
VISIVGFHATKQGEMITVPNRSFSHERTNHKNCSARRLADAEVG